MRFQGLADRLNTCIAGTDAQLTQWFRDDGAGLGELCVDVFDRSWANLILTEGSSLLEQARSRLLACLDSSATVLASFSLDEGDPLLDSAFGHVDSAFDDVLVLALEELR